MNEIPLNSSALLSCLYDSQSQFLWIRFRRGDHYLYREIPKAVVQELLEAPSQGQYFNSMIRPKFPAERLS
jgi:hypothetical protein